MEPRGRGRTVSFAAVCFWPASYLSLAAASDEPPEEPQFPMVGPARLDVSEVPTGKLNPSTVTVVECERVER